MFGSHNEANYKLFSFANIFLYITELQTEPQDFRKLKTPAYTVTSFSYTTGNQHTMQS